MLADAQDANQKLDEAGALAANGRPLDAYQALAGPCRTKGLGPAFGTKYLYFLSTQIRPALILDRLVVAWLKVSLGIRFDPAQWREKPTLSTWRS